MRTFSWLKAPTSTFTFKQEKLIIERNLVFLPTKPNIPYNQFKKFHEDDLYTIYIDIVLPSNQNKMDHRK